MTEAIAAPPVETGLPPLNSYPDVHQQTLGRWVVGVCDDQTEGMPSGLRGHIVSTRLRSSRIRLNRLDEEQSDMFDQICERSVPADLIDTKVMEAGTSSWQTWLGKKASDPQLFEYLRWHVGFIEEQQHDPGIQAEIADQRTQYKMNLERGVGEGWLHPVATDAIEKVNDIPIFIGDVFETALDEARAYCKTRTGDVVVGCATSAPTSGTYESVQCLIKQVLQHEFNHSVLGMLHGARWLNEAVTEHVAQVLMNGNLEELEPNDRFNYGPPIYPDERRILRHILENGSERIPVDLATMAYSEKPAQGNATLEHFIATVDRSWAHMTPNGSDAYYLLNMYVEGIERQLRGSGLRRQQASKQAMRNVLRDLEYQPEAVFSGDANTRQVILTA